MPTTPTWQLQEAKSRFSELVDRTLEGEPQVVTRRGKPVVVVVPYETYQTLTRPGNLSEFLLTSPLAGAELEFERDRSRPRDLDLA